MPDTFIKLEGVESDYFLDVEPSPHPLNASLGLYTAPYTTSSLHSPVTPPPSPYRGQPYPPQYRESSKTWFSTPERHRECTVQSSICPEWGPQCRDPEHINELLTQALEDIEKLEAESDERASKLLKANKKIETLKLDLKKKDKQIQTLENEVKDWKEGQKNARSFFQSKATFADAICPSRILSEQCAVQPVGLGIPGLLLDTATTSGTESTPKVRTGSLDTQPISPIRSVRKAMSQIPATTLQVKPMPTRHTLSTPSTYNSSMYESARSTPTVVRDCESVCSAEVKPPISPHFVGSPDWEPVYRLKECLAKVSQSLYAIHADLTELANNVMPVYYKRVNTVQDRDSRQYACCNSADTAPTRSAGATF